MRFVQFSHSGRRGVGVELTEGGDVVDLRAADASVPISMREFIAGGRDMMKAASKAVQSGSHVISREHVTIHAPITAPEKLVAVGRNYHDLCRDRDLPVPTEPVCFAKWSSTIVGPTDPIPYPEETTQLDWEVELAVVVGKSGRHIQRQNAMEHVFGVTCAHDVSARDWQRKNGGQVLIAKSMDRFCPLGPAIVTLDMLGDPHNLRLWTKVNGRIRQDSNTREMIFSVEDILVHISRFITLIPGDVILTGTPPGFAWFNEPPDWLQRGDRVECGLEGVGTICNTIV